MNPKTISIFIILSLVPLLPRKLFAYEASKKQNLIDETCNRSRYSNLCKALLESEPESESSDLQGLARIIIEAASANTTYVQTHIKKMMITKKDSEIEGSLRECYELYGEASDRIEDSVSAVEFENYSDVKTFVTRAIDSVVTCEEGFRAKTGHDSPVSAMGRMFTQLCTIALTITNLLGRASY